MNTSAKQRLNPFRLGSMMQFILVAVLLAGAGLGYVGIKNDSQQQMRKIEKARAAIHETRSENSLLQSRLAAYTSHSYLELQTSQMLTRLQPTAQSQIVYLTDEPVLDGSVASADTQAEATSNAFAAIP